MLNGCESSRIRRNSFLPFSLNSRCEIKRAGGEKSYFCTDLREPGWKLAYAVCWVFCHLFFNFKTVWNHTCGVTWILETNKSPYVLQRKLRYISLACCAPFPVHAAINVSVSLDSRNKNKKDGVSNLYIAFALYWLSLFGCIRCMYARRWYHNRVLRRLLFLSAFSSPRSYDFRQF